MVPEFHAEGDAGSADGGDDGDADGDSADPDLGY